MEINVRTRSGYSFAELEIESGNAKIIEDLAKCSENGYLVSDRSIEMLITAANDLSRFNGISDVDFMIQIFNKVLSDNEKSEFLEAVNPILED